MVRGARGTVHHGSILYQDGLGLVYAEFMPVICGGAEFGVAGLAFCVWRVWVGCGVWGRRIREAPGLDLLCPAQALP